MSNYSKGRTFEYDQRTRWQNMGYLVLRSAGSKGSFDLTAIPTTKYQERVILIQCKYVSTEAEAKRLVDKFVEDPPLAKHSSYVQWISVKVKGSTDIKHEASVF